MDELIKIIKKQQKTLDDLLIKLSAINGSCKTCSHRDVRYGVIICKLGNNCEYCSNYVRREEK